MQQIEATLAQELEVPNGYLVDFTGEQQEQGNPWSFIYGSSYCCGVSDYWRSVQLVATPIIIMLSSISLIGVFLGLAITREDCYDDYDRIISLAGIVVNNAIVLIDYTNLLRNQRNALFIRKVRSIIG